MRRPFPFWPCYSHCSGWRSRADEPTPAAPAAGDVQADDSSRQLSKGTQALYKNLPSLIRVRIDQGFQSMLAQPQREFNEWLKRSSPRPQPAAANQVARPMLALFADSSTRNSAIPNSRPRTLHVGSTSRIVCSSPSRRPPAWSADPRAMHWCSETGSRTASPCRSA